MQEDHLSAINFFWTEKVIKIYPSFQVPASVRIFLMFLWETTAAVVVLWRSELIQDYIVKRAKQWRQNRGSRNTVIAQGEGRNDNMGERNELQGDY